MKRSIFLALAAFVLGPGVLLGAPLSSHDPVVLNASGMRPDATNAVAPLYMLGKNNALEETVAPCGLSLRPWDGKDYRDYDWVYKPGANISLRAQTAGANGCTRAVVSLWDWLGNLVYTKTYSSFPVDDLITLKPQCHGVWLVTFDVYSGVTADSLKSRLVKSFGTPVDATSARTLWRKKNCYVIGSCFFPDRYYHWGKTWQFDHPPFPHLTPAEGIDRLADLAARCGMSVLRFDSTDKNLDVLNILQRHSIEADLKVYLRPECLVGESLVQTPRALAAWTSDLDRVIDQFLKPGDKRVAWVELGNEPAHHEFWKGTREQYEWLFEYGMKKIHASNPDMPVLQGGTCTPGPIWTD